MSIIKLEISDQFVLKTVQQNCTQILQWQYEMMEFYQRKNKNFQKLPLDGVVLLGISVTTESSAGNFLQFGLLDPPT